MRGPGASWLYTELDPLGRTRRPARAQGRHAARIRTDDQGRGHATFRAPVFVWRPVRRVYRRTPDRTLQRNTTKYVGTVRPVDRLNHTHVRPINFTGLAEAFYGKSHRDRGEL